MTYPVGSDREESVVICGEGTRLCILVDMTVRQAIFDGLTFTSDNKKLSDNKASRIIYSDGGP